MVDNALARFQPSQNNDLSTSLMGIETALANAAHLNVTAAIDGADYTVMEIRSMETIEQLKLVNGMDLAAILLRGKLLARSRKKLFTASTPTSTCTLQDMAREQGISLSELSNVRDLCFVVFPYMEDVLEMNVAQTFENIGKSNMRELVPILKAIITGAETRGTVQTGVETALNNAAASLQAVALAEGNEDEVPAADIQRQAVADLLLAGEQMPNRVLRGHVRPGAHAKRGDDRHSLR